MKIGIITQPLKTNYGGLLQNYALRLVLERLGHDVYTINRKYPSDVYSYRADKYIIFHIRQLIQKYKGKPYIPTKREWLKITENCARFINANIKVTKPVITNKDYIETSKEYHFDAYIVGSDQVWRPQYSPNIMNDFFDFCQEEKGIKRLAYAASFGVDEWEFNAEQTKECSRLAKLFKAISVREMSGIKLCKKHLGVDATFVLDPTMLLEKEDYIDLVEKANEKHSDGDLFCYILDNNEQIDEAIRNLEEKGMLRNFQVKATNTDYRLKRCMDIKEYQIPSPTRWLRAFMDAKMIFTDSFHGCVFSIIFNKTFWVIGNKGRGNTRFDSLLKLFNLENRRISVDEVGHTDFTAPINWDTVNLIKREWQDKSMNFLKNNL